ncbi:type II secretion system protein [Limisphaera ngatamarikiensis]|uniref:Type II secretion system protein n=1 Tax=Limisphaera ngatamarikiensis TaxID=1324935 RepID=A0A6M1RI37_9BACT|nr:type II secretion system protein [Limisphaera ngatamarikiensis]NGO39718.1 type II secretion system protein [Limisphaera ngatamarikiensis]
MKVVGQGGPGWLRAGAPAGPAASQRAFTMVEMALSLAIIGFALVAIVGVLPIGLQTQQENREETVVLQDAQVWLAALRAGARGYDDLTNWVESIEVHWADWTMDGRLLGQGRDLYTRTNSDIISIAPAPHLPLTNGAIIVGVMGTPKYIHVPDVFRPAGFRSNYVVAYVRAFSGPAVEKPPQSDPAVQDLAFRYRLVSEVVPYREWDTNWIAFDAQGLAPAEATQRSNYWWVARNLYANVHEVRLLFRWPVRPNGTTGNGRMVLRGTVSGVRTNQGPLHFYQPGLFARYP